MDVEVEDDAEAQRILEAMRLDAGRSIGQFVMNRGTTHGTKVRAFVALAIFALSQWPAFAWGASGPILLASILGASVILHAYAFRARLRVHVGADGIDMRPTLGRPRFVPFASIESARTEGADIQVRLHDGELIDLHSSARRTLARVLGDPHAYEADALVARIEESLARPAAPAHLGADGFTRAGREIPRWLADVRATVEERATFRSSAVPSDELWRIVEDANAPATARAGAAVAIRCTSDDDARTRLRRVAEACASPRLRVALETVASDDAEERLFGALATLEDDAPHGRHIATARR